MSTIRVSDEVKERLRDLKRDNESVNDLLDRLSRSKKDVILDAVDLLNVATAQAEGGTFVTHNKQDFDKQPGHELADVDILQTD